MLGVRRFQGTQIDLWQGDIQKFATDLCEDSPLKHMSPLETQSSDGLHRSWVSLLQRLQLNGGRHLSIAITSELPLQPLMDAIKDFLTHRDPSKHSTLIKRITLVADSMSTYDQLQDVLFASFEDLDHDSPK